MELTEDQGRAVFEDSDRQLIVHVTHEGVIIDAYHQSEDSTEPVGTIGMTAQEWWDWLERGRPIWNWRVS